MSEKEKVVNTTETTAEVDGKKTDAKVKVENMKVVTESENGGLKKTVSNGVRKVGRFLKRHWKGTVATVGLGAIAIVGGKHLLDKGYQDGYADGLNAERPSLDAPDVPAIEEPTDNAEVPTEEDLEMETEL